MNDPINGRLRSVPVKEAIETLLRHNNFKVRDRKGILFVSRIQLGKERPGGQYQSINFIEPNWISLDLQEALINEVLNEIAEEAGVSIISYTNVPGTITAKADNLPLDQALSFILKNTNSTFRLENGVYIIGDKSMHGMATRELVELKHIKSSGIQELLPQSMTHNLEIKEVKELNSLVLVQMEMDTGSRKIETK